MNQEKNSENNKKGKPNSNMKDKLPKRTGGNLYWLYGVLVLLILGFNLFGDQGASKEITATKFKTMAENGDVEAIKIVNNDKVDVLLKKGAFSKYQAELGMKDFKPGKFNSEPILTFNIGNSEKLQAELVTFAADKGIEYTFEKEDNWLGDLVVYMLPIAVLIFFWLFMMRRMGGNGPGGGQIFSIGKSKATLFDKNQQVKVTFNDVAGLEGAKEEVMEIVDFLKNPGRYTSLGAKIPKGALLVGPPGTGKTLLAKAVAGEAQVPFFSISGSDFVEMFVGVGASRVRDLFKQAKEKSPCIIFIDEIDAIGRARGKSPMQGANDERENTLNQLLTEMDGFGSNSGVIILAATNRADILDRALLRPGRFDRQIHVDLPEVSERKEIFKVHLRPLKLNQDVDVDFLANQTPGFSGAEIANLCNEAALIAARHKHENITRQDFLDAVDRIIAGLEKKSKIITPSEKKVIAYHEAGHATTSWLMEFAHPLVKVTIVPRGKSLGAAWYLPEERQITTTEQLLHEMMATLGGRAAEEVIFGQISTGALSDLEKVTKQAYAMVSIYGLDEEIGNLSFYDSTGQSDYSFQKPYSDSTAKRIDERVSALVEKMYQKTVALLSDNKDKLTELAEVLLEKEVIFRDDLVEIFGERNFGSDKAIEAAEETETEAKSETNTETE